MIQTYSTTIRRKEMDAVLTCMVDEKIGPGEINSRLLQTVKEFFGCDGCVALRSPAIALRYALQALGIERGSKIMISALAPAWHYQALEDLEMIPMILDVQEADGLVSLETIQLAMKDGGKVLLLHETEGIVPDLSAIVSGGVYVIEDVSKSAGAKVPVKDEDGNVTEQKNAGLFGVYSILGMEEKDVITCGGGAVLMAPGRREWVVLKKYTDLAPVTDLLPDINSALAWVQLKEYPRNERVRKEIYGMYQHSCLIGKHKMFAREMDESSTMCSFPLVLNGSFKDVKQYASKKDIEIRPAFEDSVIGWLIENKPEASDNCNHAKSLFLRCAHFPLYPRLTHNETAKIAKVLGSLP